ncbi:MAG: virulence RhuM family protein [Burkholderiaceae bacterium]|nr:virulence RhuM family protein [Burkholderiaceae bacterium]
MDGFRTPDYLGLHLKNIFEDGELSRGATTEESSVVQPEGGREVRRPATLYNLDAILAVGFRVRSPRDVRASEKRFYQKVRDLFALSTSSRPTAFRCSRMPPPSAMSRCKPARVSCT